MDKGMISKKIFFIRGQNKTYLDTVEPWLVYKMKNEETSSN